MSHGAIREKNGRLATNPVPASRFWSKVEKTDGCWNWMGSTARGYGQIWWNKRQQLAHRVSLELAGREIPRGMEVDHLCRNHGCVNPSHLEVVTPRENKLRGVGPSAVNAKKTHCPLGHKYSPENTKHGFSGRSCRTCENRRTSERKKQHKAQFARYQEALVRISGGNFNAPEEAESIATDALADAPEVET